MISSSRPVNLPDDAPSSRSQEELVGKSPRSARSSEEKARAFRMAALVMIIWGVASLPFFLGFVQCPSARLFHFACPGCGMSRAIYWCLHDHAYARSFAIHPLAFPTLLSQLIFSVATIVATARFGAPWLLVRAKWGRLAVGLVALVMILDIVLWALRMFGAFGGPVPV